MTDGADMMCAEQMHPYDAMTELQLTAHFQAIAREISRRVPANTGFILLASPFGRSGVSQYVANGQREDCISWLRETADRLESKDTVQRAPWTLGRQQ